MTDKIKHRGIFSSLLVSLISLTSPGIGHIFAAKLKRGLLIFAAIIAVLVLTALFGIMNYFSGGIVTYTLLIAIWIFMVIDSYRLNRNKAGITLKAYNKWYLYIIFGICSWVLINFFVASWGFRHFRVLAVSNYPTLKVGDVVLAKMNYGLKPGLHITQPVGPILVVRIPQYKVGDLVLIKLNKTQLKQIEERMLTKLPEPVVEKMYNRLLNKYLIKRIVAKSGDQFEIKDGISYLNRKKYPQPYVLPSHNKTIMSLTYNSIKVPSGYVLVLGDNRDNSFDSRSFGLLPDNAVQGLILYKIW